MPRLAWVFALCLLASVPAIGLEDPPLRELRLKPPGPQPFLTVRADPAGNAPTLYSAPKADGAVVELLDEGVEPLFPLLINDGGGEAGTIVREDRDVFAGVEAVRVTPVQKYRTRIPGWDFKIVEKPEKAGEFRYLRFAWKKVGGVGIMIQFHDPAKSWGFRYFAGQNAVGWQPATSVTDKLPADWELVTRDLFKDYGAFNISGVALTAMYGERDTALFDHMLLGRTVEDLDKATDVALGRVKPARALAGKDRDALWLDLLSTDRPKAAAAIRAFLSAAPDQVAFISDRLAETAPKSDMDKLIRKLVADLDADDFDTRDRATDELVKLGAPAREAVGALAKSGNDEERFRARIILKKLGEVGEPVSNAGKMARVVRVLERAGTKDARELLTHMAAGEFGFDSAPDAKAALARLPRLP